MVVYHYVYEMRVGIQFYIGCRSSKVHPELDFKYRGSGVWCLYGADYGRAKKVLSIWQSREDAEREESRLICELRFKVGCMNRRIPKPRRQKSHV